MKTEEKVNKFLSFIANKAQKSNIISMMVENLSSLDEQNVTKALEQANQGYNLTFENDYFHFKCHIEMKITTEDSQKIIIEKPEICNKINGFVTSLFKKFVNIFNVKNVNTNEVNNPHYIYIYKRERRPSEQKNKNISTVAVPYIYIAESESNDVGAIGKIPFLISSKSSRVEILVGKSKVNANCFTQNISSPIVIKKQSKLYYELDNIKHRIFCNYGFYISVYNEKLSETRLQSHKSKSVKIRDS